MESIDKMIEALKKAQKAMTPETQKVLEDIVKAENLMRQRDIEDARKGKY